LNNAFTVNYYYIDRLDSRHCCYRKEPEFIYRWSPYYAPIT